jgi:hypothetical protein
MPVQPGPDGALESDVLGITLGAVDGKLEITRDGGSATVSSWQDDALLVGKIPRR